MMESHSDSAPHGIAAIAIIGMAGRFPGARDIEELWRNLAAGVESITFFSEQELREAGVEPAMLSTPGYVGARAVLDGAEMFDAAFFDLSPREAEVLDPQHRLLLECAWEALEHAGYDPRRYAGPVGVFAGAGFNTYLLSNVQHNPEVLGAAGAFQVMLGNGPDTLATRISYKLGLRGPSVTVQTACSTSLVAVHLAVQSLLNGECDMALAGGVRLLIPRKGGHVHQPGGIFSRDGHCRAFDAAATGATEGEGQGLVVLKRLADAVADGDRIHAVILGSAINNDGSGKMGYTVPSIEGQSEVIAMAQALAGVDPGTIGMIEAHGTGTPLGDPIEVAALSRVFSTAEPGLPCALGSLKTNIGHMDAAAGIGSLIKAALAIERGVIPPSLHFERPNPQIDLPSSPFYVPVEATAWPGEGPRRAGVSSFGIGGTNAHVVLEEAPEAPAGGPSRPLQLLVLSAPTPTALEKATQNLAEHLRRQPGTGLADIAYTLQVGRAAFDHRRVVVCASSEDAAEVLSSLDPKRVLTRTREAGERSVFFLFPGQGSQHPGMGLELYRQEAVFRDEVDRCAAILEPLLGLDLRQVLYPDGDPQAAAGRLQQTALAQPALFVIEHALARLWMSWGIQPKAMLGHSIGEYVAACLAGVFPLEDALRLVAERGRLMQEMPGGSMLAVPLPESELAPLLGGLSLAAVNGPAMCVVSGETAEIDDLAARLAERGVQARRLHTSHAFHSASMEPMLERFEAAFQGVRLGSPKIPFLSNLTGTWIRPEEAGSPRYWVRHLRETVRFSEGLEALFAQPSAVFLETGPGQALTALARQHPGRPAAPAVVPSLPSAGDGRAADAAVLRALGQLWMAGVEIDWPGFRSGERRLRVPLPTYPFERQRYWVEPISRREPSRPRAPSGAQEIADWFWVPLWRQALAPAPDVDIDGGWLIFADEAGLGDRLAERLRERGATVTVVHAGEIRPGVAADYADLLAQGSLPARIVHLWSVGPSEEDELERSFFSLFHLARALGERRATGEHPPLHLGIVSTGAQRVGEDDDLRPVRATLLGPAATIPQEYPGITCAAIDVTLPAPGSPRERRLVDLLLAELAAPGEPVVAYRGTGRWLPLFEPLHLENPRAPLPLRQEGTYLITGGLGGVGLEIAGLLARLAKPRLVLTSRAAFPDRETWPELARGTGRTARIASRLVALEDAGAEVRVAAADVTDASSMRRLLGEIGRIDGVVHAAGLPGGGLLQWRSEEDAAAVLAPKVTGTLLLAELLAGDPPDFLVLCSSLNALIGGPGQSDYTAANAFLDAFAQSRADDMPVLSINWAAWRGVGMAALLPGAEEDPTVLDLKPHNHPLLRDRGTTADGGTVFVARLHPAGSWVVDEHRLGGSPVVPGTAYLEMADAAFRGVAGEGGVEIRDVQFLRPLRMADGETREVHTVLQRNGDGFHRFSIRSREDDGWQEHVTGSVGPATGEPEHRDLSSWAGWEEEVMGEDYREDLKQAGFGPRWEALRKVYRRNGEVVGRLELAPEFAADVEAFRLHPALLDVATGFAQAYVEGRTGYYLPLSYRRLEVKGPLPARLYSHARLRSDGLQSLETLSFDIAVLDETGQERLRIEEYTIKRVDVAASLRGAAGTTTGKTLAFRQVEENLGSMEPGQAVEAFRRILGSMGLPQIAISVQPLPDVVERARSMTAESLLETVKLTSGGHARPDLQTPYVEPRGELEERLAAIWRLVLGLDRVGAADDFFELGGHSLLGTQLISRVREAFGVEMPLGRLFEASTVADLAAVIAAQLSASGAAGESERIPRLAHGGGLELSFAQERLWFLERLEPGSAAYHLPTALRIEGDLDRPALARTLGEIVRRHAALRSAITGEETPVQTVLADVPLPLVTADLLALPAGARQAEADRLMAEEARRPFDLGRPPLLRVLLVRLEESDWRLVFVVHHLVGDGWSTTVLIRETVALYTAFRAGRPSPLPELPVQYQDFAVWQRGWLQGETLRRQLDWWRQELADAPAVSSAIAAIDLPWDRPRAMVRGRQAAVARLALGTEMTAALNALARREGVTLFMILLAAWQTLLHRTGGSDDVLVGSPVANRTRVELEPLIGLFVNMLVMRGRFADATTFRGLLERTRTAALGAFAHQDLPFERLVEELAIERSLSATPLFQVVLVLQNAPATGLTLPGATLTPQSLGTGEVKFDLAIDWMEGAGGLEGVLEYAADLFDSPTIQRLLGQLRILLEAVAVEPGERISALPLLGEAERHQLLAEWNDTGADYPRDEPLHALVARHATNRPDAPALVFQGETVSYGDFVARFHRLGGYLMRELGVGLDDRVALFLQRTPEAFVATLGVLAAGGAYVPLDPDLPAERLAQLLGDARPRLVLTDAASAAALPPLPPDIRVVRIDEAAIDRQPSTAPASGADGSSLAYIMYTSGSTGRPKGAGVVHRGVARLGLAQHGPGGYDVMRPDDVSLHIAPHSFDATTLELWPALLAGARMVISPQRVLPPQELGQMIAEHGVTVLWLTAGLFHQMVDENLEGLRPLRLLMAGGESLSAPHVRRVLEALPGLKLMNGYGPTEVTVFTTSNPLRDPAAIGETVPVGRPIAETRAWVLDRDLRLAPPGVAGELYAAGDGVARGYVDRPEVTAERFVPNPFAATPGERLYRTGDRVRTRPDGSLEFLGRLDRQVKIRGFRIEPGEIEAVLAEHPAVMECAVVVREEPAGRRLVACVVPQGDFDPQALREFLRPRLLDSMVPSAWVRLDALPLTPNGKVDRRALERMPVEAPAEDAASHEPPQGPMETLVAGIWAGLLGRERLGRQDDFFALGGHSLLATRAISRVRRALGAEVPLRLLFEAPTVQAFARALQEAAPSAEAITAADRHQSLPLSFAQERLWFLDRLLPHSPLYNVPTVLRARGDLDVAAFTAAVRSVVRRHEILRTTYGAEAGLPVQRIAPEIDLSMPEIDLRELAPEIRDAEARRLAGDEARRPFDLGTGPLLRVALARTADDERLVLATFHHIVADGWSMDVFLRDLAAFYRGEEPRPLPVQYADYAAWQRRRLSGETLDAELAHWRQALDGAPWVLELPADRPRPPVLTYRGARELFHLPSAVLEDATALGRRHEATPFMVLLTVFEILLARLTGREELIVGTPVANRDRFETEGLIGFFMNTLPLRASLDGEPGLDGLLPRVRSTALAAYAHQELPFEKLVEELKPARDLAHTPLVQVVFTLLAASRPVELSGIGAGVELAETLEGASETGTARFDLTLNLSDGPGGLSGAMEHNLDLFDAATARRFAGGYATLLAAALADPGRPFRELPLLSPEEREQLLGEWNDTAEPLPHPAIHRWIEEQARRRPDALAVIHDRSLTYAELDAEADRLARRLAAAGVGPERCVAVCLERSADMVVALLAILKTGGAWLPLDPGHPRERLSMILEDAGRPLMLTTRGMGLASEVPDVLWLDGASEEAPVANPLIDGDSLAYVIFTSGSTGRPKGVQVVRRGLANFLASMRRRPGLGEDDTLVAVTTLTFDIAGLELLLPLTVGARVVVADREVAADGARLAALLDASGATAMQATPATWRLLLESGWQAPAGFKALCGGEALPGDLAARLGSNVWNLYGPTETTIWSAVEPVQSTDRAVVPLGRPIANTRIHLAGRSLEAVPVGVAGELLIGGAGLARGYLGRPDLTADRFVPDPFGAPGARLYRTGDLARRLPDGRLEFLGRLDHQVKIRGYRIELGEIEAALADHPAIRHAVVADLPDPAGGRRLVAWAEAEGSLGLDEVRAFLRARLPEYMLPAAFVRMESLPLNLSGKVDRKALPDPSPERPALAIEYVAPREGREAALAALWSEILGVERVGIHDSFFDLGGHSLLLMRLQGRIAAETGIDVPVLELFEHPTVAALARRLDELAAGTAGTADAVDPGLDDRAEELRKGKERRARRRRASEVEV